MKRCPLWILSAVGLLAVAVPAPAQVSVQTPRFSLSIGRPVYPPPPVVVAPPPAVVVQPGPALPALTLREFAAGFQPLPGTYHVWLIHPQTGCPVSVCFSLPAGCPKVRVHRRELTFDYGRHQVELRFDHRGGVRVHER